MRGIAYDSTLRMLRRARPARPAQRFKLAILKPDRLGDGVLSLGAARLLTRRFGEADTLLVVSPIAEALFRQEFPQAAMLVLPAFCQRFFPDFVVTLARHARTLRAIEADLLVCLRHQPSDYLHAIARLMQVQKVIASRWSGPQEHTSLAYPHATLINYPQPGDVPTGDAAPGMCLELRAHRRLVSAALDAPVSMEAIRPAFCGPSPRTGTGLLVCPAAGDALREYPPALLAEAVSLFAAAHPSVPIVLCVPPDDHRGEVERAFQSASVTVSRSVGSADFRSLLDEVARAGIVLAPDSAPAHIATALDKPGVFILGGGHHGLFAPWARSARQCWLSHPLPCYQCRWRCDQAEPFCITRITPRQVAAALGAAYDLRQR